MKRDDPILDLIRQADEATDPCETLIDVEQIYRRDRRIRRIYRGLVAGIMILFVLSVFLMAPKEQRSRSISLEVQTLAQLEARAEGLLAKAEFALGMDAEVQEQLGKMARISELETQMKRIQDPLRRVQTEVSRTAEAMVVCADRYRSIPGLKREAIKEYKRVLDLFPGNSWADVARKRLLELTFRKEI